MRELSQREGCGWRVDEVHELFGMGGQVTSRLSLVFVMELFYKLLVCY